MRKSRKNIAELSDNSYFPNEKCSFLTEAALFVLAPPTAKHTGAAPVCSIFHAYRLGFPHSCLIYSSSHRPEPDRCPKGNQQPERSGCCPAHRISQVSAVDHFAQRDSDQTADTTVRCLRGIHSTRHRTDMRHSCLLQQTPYRPDHFQELPSAEM